MELTQRLVAIRASIRAAQTRSGRTNDEITIVAVTKHRSAATVDAAAAAGLLHVGENRLQEAWAKASEVAAPVTWHFIGHVQGNKAKRAAELFSWIHSVDSIALLTSLDRVERPNADDLLQVFLQINIAGEAQKSGVSPDQARALWQHAARCKRLRVAGLMTMAPYASDPEQARPVFRALRSLRDDLNQTGDTAPIAGLSMGMSGDYEVAIEEGATHIRLGTALFGPRE